MKPARKFDPALKAQTFKHKAATRNDSRQAQKAQLRKDGRNGQGK